MLLASPTYWHRSPSIPTPSVSCHPYYTGSQRSHHWEIRSKTTDTWSSFKMIFSLGLYDCWRFPSDLRNRLSFHLWPYGWCETSCRQTEIHGLCEYIVVTLPTRNQLNQGCLMWKFSPMSYHWFSLKPHQDAMILGAREPRHPPEELLKNQQFTWVKQAGYQNIHLCDKKIYLFNVNQTVHSSLVRRHNVNGIFFSSRRRPIGCEFHCDYLPPTACVINAR